MPISNVNGHQLQLHPLAPEFFQFVQLAALFLHDVNDNFAQIDNNPVRSVNAFHAHWRKAQDIIAIDVKGKSSITDCMVICTGTSNRHVMSIAEHVVVDFIDNEILKCFTLQVFPLRE